MVEIQNIRVTMVPKYKVEAILDTKNPTRSITAIMDDLARIIVKQDDAINLDDAQKVEELGIELIRIARDMHSACFSLVGIELKL